MPLNTKTLTLLFIKDMLLYRLFFTGLCLFITNVMVFAQNPNTSNEQNKHENMMMPGGMPFGGMMPMGGMMPGGGPMFMNGNINQFDINFATEVPEEKDAVIKDKNDSLYTYYVENIKFSKTAKIHFNDNDVQITDLPENVSITKDGAYLSITSNFAQPLAFEISGKTDNGSLTLNTKSPIKLLFNNTTIKSQRGHAILVEGKAHVYAVIAENSTNELSDCRNPELPPIMGFPPMGTFRDGAPSMGERPNFPPEGMQPPFMERKREENPEDYHVQYGIRMKKPQMKKKIKVDGTFVCDGHLSISGKGTLQVLSNNKIGIKSKESLMIRPGNLITVRALSGKGINAKNELYIYGGTLNVDCSFSADKALTAGRNLYIKGGHTVIKAGGSESSEGIQSKFLMQIDGGKLEVAAQDDAINSQGDLVINGGDIRAFSATNDAFDSNCNMIINGGNVFASGNGMPEGGLDCADEEGYNLFINGGTVIAIGGRHSNPEKQSRQPSIQWSLDNLSPEKTYSVEDFCIYKSSRTYQMGGATLLFSSPNLKKGKTYSLFIDGEKAETVESLSAPFSNAGRRMSGFPFGRPQR